MKLESELYGIENITLSKSRFAYVSGTHFLDGKRNYRTCGACGVAIDLPTTDILVDLDGGNTLPDYFYCSSLRFIVSERVLESWQNANVVGYKYYNVHFDKVKPKALRRTTLPKYFHIDIPGFCNWDKEKTDLEVIRTCPTCGVSRTRKKVEDYPKFYLDYKTWDHSDIVRTDITYVKFCTSKIVECTLKNKHTGIEFYNPVDLWLEDRKYLFRND